jgi:hypothetical protein
LLKLLPSISEKNISEAVVPPVGAAVVVPSTVVLAGILSASRAIK